MLTRQQGLDPGPAWYQPSPARSLAVLSASFKTALHSLGAHRLRSTLTVLGIVIGIAAVIVMISVGNGAQEQIARQIRSLGANVFGISPGSIAMKSVRLGAGTASKLSNDAAEIESEVAGVLAVAPCPVYSGPVHLRLDELGRQYPCGHPSLLCCPGLERCGGSGTYLGGQ